MPESSDVEIFTDGACRGNPGPGGGGGPLRASWGGEGMGGEWGGWKKRGGRTADKQPVKNIDLWQRLDAAAARHQVGWEWVRGHAGHPENERADALARARIIEAG